MKSPMNKIFRFSALMAAFLATASADAIGPQNSRSATAGNVAPARAAGRDVKRGAPSDDGVAALSRSATARTSGVVARSAATPSVGRVATATASRNARNAATISRSAVGARAARSATVPARSTTNVSRAGVSRAASSRATAIFDDVSKIGGGYAQCRESYATCMDQFCAKANDTYRRCFCSDRFTAFRDTEDALDQAKILLQQFEDNNLNAVDKTAAEVDAMYSATVGEAAIKNDTSGAAKILAEIGDLISGKKKANTSSSSNSMSLSDMSLDFSSDIGDIWGGSSSVSSIFGGGSGVDLTTLEGEDLFNHVHKQCSQMVAESCQSSAVANMAKSAYGIMISQDCNAYEKSIDAKRQQVQNTVRQAEKILREARLEEYRAHNSQDVNECLDKVRSAMLAETACGPNYKRCLDYSGAYINQSTGEPIYTQRLFELADLIKLDGASGDMDVLGQNDKFNEFLDSRKMFATTALDSCRSISDLVWTEFKRAALIEISQAQDEKIEEVKGTCVDTMRECYDTQSDSLKSFDDTTAEAAGAISAYAARSMCQEKVVACASLYGDTNGCQFDGNGKLVTGNNGNRCGLDALLMYVDTVDTVRVAEGCDVALNNFVTELCTPTDGKSKYPFGCARLTEENLTKQITDRAGLYCVDINGNKYTTEKDEEGNAKFTDPTVQNTIDQLVRNVKYEISSQLRDKCEEVSGIWLEDQDAITGVQKYETKFYNDVFGLSTANTTAVAEYSTHGICIENTVRYACTNQDEITGSQGWAKYDETRNTCTFTDDWYKYQCETMLDGYWDQGICYWDSTSN